MKSIKLLLLFLALACVCRSQIPWGKYSQSYIDDEGRTPQLIAAILSGNNSFWEMEPADALQQALKKNESFQKIRPANFVSIKSYDNEKAHFFVKDAGKQQLEYRVLLDGNQTLAQWSPLTNKAADSVQRQSTLRDLWYVGGYKAPIGHYIVVDVREKDQPNIISTAVVNWKPIRPLLYNIYTVHELNEFLLHLSHPNGTYLTEKEIEKWRNQYGADNLDIATSLPKKLISPAKDNNLIFVLRADLTSKEQLQYELVKDNKVIRPWDINDFDNNFIWLKDLMPGDYKLRVRFTAQPENVMDYEFEVQQPPGPSTTYLIGISSLIAAFLALIIVISLYLRQKRKTSKATLQKEKLDLEMKGLKSQLNPHFVFNSLNSIQGLVNTGRIQESNEYLVLFAKLMRETLALSDIDQAPLQKEIEYLDAYLRMEQLRFNFTYWIHTDAMLNTAEINFPTLLLQPLVENAVKHGVANKQNGRIEIKFSKKGTDLVVTIHDNGKGFTNLQQQHGYGLHLTKQRLNLLNQQVTMHIESQNGEGSNLQLIFKAWLHETKNDIN